jgi:hypothetical protein
VNVSRVPELSPSWDGSRTIVVMEVDAWTHHGFTGSEEDHRVREITRYRCAAVDTSSGRSMVTAMVTTSKTGA